MPRRTGARVSAFLAPALLGGCGVGTAAIGAAASDGGGTSNAPAVVSGFRVEEAERQPARLVFVLSDRESNLTRLSFGYDAGEGPVPLTQIAAAPATFATSPDGIEYALSWYFSDEPGLPDDGHLVRVVTVMAFVQGGSQAITPGANADEVALGNDPPRIVSAATPGPEVAGIAAVPFTVADSSDHAVRIRVEYDAGAGWRPALPVGGLPPSGFAFEDIVARDQGTDLLFFWDTDDATQLKDVERDVRVRFTPEDAFDAGEPVETPPFAVDNNDAPIAFFDSGPVINNPDETRGIALPYLLQDEEEDDVRVVFQWRRETQAGFPELPSSVTEIEQVLADPEQRRELRICTEMELPFEGSVLPTENADQVILPELASTRSAVLASGVEGRTLELLRPSRHGERVAASWAANPLEAPVDALPVGNGPTALVLDAPFAGGWRLRELDLATGEVVDGHEAAGSGTPSAMDLEPGGRAVVVASYAGATWQVQRVDLEHWTSRLLVTGQDGEVESGPIRDIAALGTGASLITVGGSLVRLDYPASSRASAGGDPVAGPHVREAPGGVVDLPAREADVLPLKRATTLLDGLATPWGVVLDRIQRNRIYLAERDFARADGGVGRVQSIELDTYDRRDVFVDPATAAAGQGLERPTAIALEKNGSRLLAVTGAHLRALDVNGRDSGVVFDLADDLPPDTGGLSVGPDDQRLLALPGASDLVALGGVSQRRSITGYDPVTRTVAVSEPFDPPPRSGTRWRVRDVASVRRSSATGRMNFFVWDSGDVPEGGVYLRVVPLDTDIGVADEGQASKRVRSFEDIRILGNEGGQIDVKAADLNGDGRADLVSTGQDSHGFLIYLADAKGAFPDPPLVVGSGPPTGPLGIVAADLDGDGDIDLAGSRLNRLGVELFYQVDGGWAAGPDRILGVGSPQVDDVIDLEAADLDRDGDLDLVAANSDIQPPAGNPNNLALFYQPDGGFMDAAAPAPVLDPMEGIDPGFVFRICEEDLDGDGWVDLVSANRDKQSDAPPPHTSWISVFLQCPGGGFQERPTIFLTSPGRTGSAELADVDADGHPDLIWFRDDVAAIYFERPRLPGLFLARPDLSFGDLLRTYPLAADVDADGRLDVLGCHPEGDLVAVHRQDSTGRFPLAADAVLSGPDSLRPLSLLCGDWNGDGGLDLASAASTTVPINVGLWEQEAPGGYSSEAETLLGTAETTDRPQSLAVADLDGDGLLDLVSANGVSEPSDEHEQVQSSNLAIFRQKGPGAFAAEPDIVIGGLDMPPANPSAVVAADLDGDGATDLASANRDGNDLTVFLHGAATYALHQTLGGVATTRGPRALAAADLDGDGDLDLVCACTRGDVLAIFRQTGGGTYLTAPVRLGATETVLGPRSLAAVDLDLDGGLDVVSANSGSSDVTLFSRPADGFGDPDYESPDVVLDLAVQSFSDDDVRLVVGDENDDGRPDVLASVGRSIRLFRQPAHGFESTGVPDRTLDARFPVFGMGLADLDLDGQPDLVAGVGRGENSALPPRGRLVLFLGRGAGLPASADRVMGNNEGALRFDSPLVADLNSDGEPDLAAGAAFFYNPASLEGAFDKLALFFGGK